MRTRYLFRWFMLLTIMAMAALSHLPATARAAEGDSPAAVVAWNSIAVHTVVDLPVPGQLGAGLPPAHSLIMLSYVQAAVYNAVLAIEGGYQPYHSDLGQHPDASLDAAVAAAARDVLVYYFPAQQSLLDIEYTAALGAIPDSPAKAAGIALGQDAAAELISLRQGDGLGVPYAYALLPAGPGVWTPPANGGLTPWVAVMRPFLISSPNQFRPGPPLSLKSPQWVKNYNETLSLGRSNSATRTPEQTDAARFWTDNPGRQNNRAMTAVILARGLDAMQAARLYAMGNLVNADAGIACWDAKYFYQFWRPGPAIVSDIDGNQGTISDPTWTPLLPTPPHPEYPSGHGCATSSMAEVFTQFLGTKNINIDVTTAAAGVSQTTRHFATADDLRSEIIDVRIWSGIHYRDSDEVGVKMGQKLAHWALAHNFLPVD